MLKEQGHHLSEGVELINLILSQMNNYRLSTSNQQPPVDRVLLLEKISQLLSGPRGACEGRVGVTRR
jgi:hypothetical protein